MGGGGGGGEKKKKKIPEREKKKKKILVRQLTLKNIHAMAPNKFGQRIPPPAPHKFSNGPSLRENLK